MKRFRIQRLPWRGVPGLAPGLVGLLLIGCASGVARQVEIPTGSAAESTTESVVVDAAASSESARHGMSEAAAGAEGGRETTARPDPEPRAVAEVSPARPARPVRQRAGEAIPRATSPNIRGVAVPVHLIERSPQVVETRASRAAASRPLRADLPGPAGAPKPGSRGIGFPIGAGAAASVGGATPSPLAPSVGGDFDSTTYDDNAVNTGAFFIPADPVAAAGPTSLVNAVNVTLRFHGKDGSLTPADEMALADFFSGLAPDSELFDPKVLYDENADRFVVVALDYCDSAATCTVGTKGSRIFVAVSDDSTPQGVWYLAAIEAKLLIPAGNPVKEHWVDFPGLAVDEEAVYITGNMFDFTSGDFGGVRLWIVDKVGGTGGGFYGGGTATVFGPYDPYESAGVATTTQPAHVFGEPADADLGTFLVSYSGLSSDCLVSPPAGCAACPSGGDFDGPESVQLVRVDDPLGTPTFTQELVPVTNLESRGDCSELPTAPQDGAPDVETNGRSVLNAVWRDESLYFAATIDPRSGADAGEATAHWWQLDVSTPGSISVTDQGDVSGDADIAADSATFFPSIAVNVVGEMTLGFSASAATIFPGSYYTTRNPGDPPSTTSGEATLRAGLDGYQRTFGLGTNRWGDYSSVAVDPVTQCFWVYNKHALCMDGSGGDVAPCPAEAVADNGRWGTAYGRVCVDCETSPLVLADWIGGTDRRASEITLEGTADILAATGPVELEGQAIGFENGFSVEAGGQLAVYTGFCPLP